MFIKIASSYRRAGGGDIRVFGKWSYVEEEIFPKDVMVFRVSRSRERAQRAESSFNH